MSDAAQQALAGTHLRRATLVRGVGIIYFAILPDNAAPETLRHIAGACAKVFDAAAKLGGHAAVPWCPTALKKEINVWGPPRGDMELMRRVKRVFDPHSILSPGRFVGGL